MTQSVKRTGNYRTWGTLLLTIALAGSVIGCSSSGSKPTASKSPDASQAPSTSAKPGELNKDEKAELTLWATPTGTLPGQQPGDWIKSDLMKEWNALYPNVKINVEMVPFEGINEKVTTAIASRTTPDILFDYPGRTLAYGQMGALASLDDAIPPAELELVKKNPDVMKMVAVNGNIVTMPFSATLVGLILNKSLWKEANAENLLPKDEFRTWTPEEFKAALKAVANKDKSVYGLTSFAINEQGDQLYYNTMTAFGAKLFNADYTKYTAADSPEGEQALAFFQSLVDEGLVHPHPETISAVNALDYWKQKKNGMVVGTAAHSEIVKSGLKDGSVVGPHEYMYVNYPSPKKGQSALKMETGFGVVFKKNDPLKEKWAKRFLYWSQVESPTFATAGKGFNPFGKPPTWTEGDPELQFLAKLATKAKEWPIVDPGFGIKGYPEMRAAMFPEMQKMFIKGATPKQTIDNISKKFNDVIKKYTK